MPPDQVTALPQGMHTETKAESVFGAPRVDDHQNEQASRSNSKSKKLSSGGVEGGNEENFNDIDRNGRPIRANRGKRTQWPSGFSDSSTLVVDSSDEEEELVMMKSCSEDSDSEEQNSHTHAFPDLSTMRAPSPPPLPRLPPAVVPLPTNVPEIPHMEVSCGTASSPFAGVSPEGSTVPPLKITIHITKGYEGPLEVNVDYNSIFEAMRPLLTFHGGKDVKAEAKAKNPPPTSAVEPLALEGYVPIRYSSRVTTNINFDSIIRNRFAWNRTLYYDAEKYLEPQASGSLKPRVVRVPKPFHTSAPKKHSFLDLSGEVRNRIYRLVLRGEPVQFTDGTNFEHSASLLRTCKTIHEETRPILYGENDFIFERDPQKCGVFWRPDRSEIGYSNVRRFLEMIGPVNIGLIRLVGFNFEDAVPSAAPGKTINERRYANDVHCLHVLELFGRYGNLHKATIGLYGRRILSRKRDSRFVWSLRDIPADVVVFRHPRFENNFRFQYLDLRTRDSLKQYLMDGMLEAKKIKVAEWEQEKKDREENDEKAKVKLEKDKLEKDKPEKDSQDKGKQDKNKQDKDKQNQDNQENENQDKEKKKQEKQKKRKREADDAWAILVRT